ncbi:MAG: hypothetical protein ABIA75_03795 [Candidatus Neomarinimicrobiota bacterium]
MNFGRWLNSLTGLDHLVLLVCIGLSVLAARYILHGVRNIYEHLQKDNRYAPEFRVTPAASFLVVLPVAIIIYLALGLPLSGWLHSVLP